MKKFFCSVAVVVPTYNRRALSVATLKSLSADDGYLSQTIFVCDSDSTDGTQEAARQFPNTFVIDAGSQKWWSGSVNLGIRKAIEENFDFVLLLNDDLSLPKNLVSTLVELALQQPESIVTAAQSTEGKIFLGQKVVGLFRNLQDVITTGKNLVDIDLINGSCLLIPIDLFKKIGIIDEARCPHLAGDNEFLLRARNAGIRLLVATEVIIEQGAPTDLSSRYCLRKLLSAPYSPYRLDTHLAFGRQLFGSWLGLATFGICFNTRFLLSLIKASLISVFRNRCI
jgi:GT2 family glycosyltransferase